MPTGPFPDPAFGHLEAGRRTVAVAPQDPGAYARLADLQLQLYEIAAAERLYALASTLDPAHPTFRRNQDQLRWMQVGTEKKMIRYLESFRRRLAPYVMLAPMVPDGRFGGVDPLGFPIPPEPVPGRYRVLVVGDCIAEGAGGFSLATELHARIRRDGRDDVDILNFGCVSGTRSTMVHLLIERLPAIKPDVVFVLAGGNDVLNPFSYDPRPGFPFNFHILETLHDAMFPPGDGQGGTPLPNFMEAIKAAARRQAALRTVCGWQGQAWRDTIVATFIGNVGKLAAIARGFRIDLVFALQPIWIMKDQLVGTELRIPASAEAVEHARHLYARMRGDLAALCRSPEHASPHFHAYDGSPLFAKAECEIFTDAIHLNATGHHILADAVWRMIAPRIEHNAVP